MPVPLRPCPFCRHASPRLLASPTKVAHVIYYRCDACAHVWHVDKTDPDGYQTPVANRHTQDRKDGLGNT